MAVSLQTLAPAKINLALHVTGRRPPGDAKAGYHELDSLVAFASIGDELTVAEAESLTLTLVGPFSKALQSDSDNLVLKAARWLQQRSGVQRGAAITLTKNLPVASGIGGGSADAAAALRLLASLWQVALPNNADETLPLGADVPVCLASRPSRLQGVGEKLTPAGVLPSSGLLLVNPGIALATPPVFAARQGPFGSGLKWPRLWPTTSAGFCTWLAEQRNDLEPAAIGLCPEIAEVLQALRREPQIKLARMSGSGATCFALLPDLQSGQWVEAQLKTHNPAWWVASGTFLNAAELR